MTDTDPIQCGKRKQCRQQCGITDQLLFLIYQDRMWNIPFMCKHRPALQPESLLSHHAVLYRQVSKCLSQIKMACLRSLKLTGNHVT